MRSSGVLMHISSLPSPYGIGTMGKEARKFVDFLDKSGQKYWQILPICPTSYGDSPYQSFSTFSGNPYYIDLEALIQDGLLTRDECRKIDFGDDPESVDYEKLYNGRYILLRKAFERSDVSNQSSYCSFMQDNKERKMSENTGSFIKKKRQYQEMGMKILHTCRSEICARFPFFSYASAAL